MYVTHITLQYPKGRVHEDTLTTWDCLDVGSEFELYGHHWKVVELTSPHSRYDERETRLLCEIADVAIAA